MTDELDVHNQYGQADHGAPLFRPTLVFVNGNRTRKDIVTTARVMSDLEICDLSPFGHGGAGEFCGGILRALQQDPAVCTLVRPTPQQLENVQFQADLFASAGMIYLTEDVMPVVAPHVLKPQQRQLLSKGGTASLFVQTAGMGMHANVEAEWDGCHAAGLEAQPQATPGTKNCTTADNSHDAFCLTLLAAFSRRFNVQYAVRLARAAAVLEILEQPATSWKEIMEFERQRPNA